MQEHVHNEPGDIEAWLELALIRIDFDLNCTDNDAYNEVSQLQTEDCFIFEFVRCMLLCLVCHMIPRPVM